MLSRRVLGALAHGLSKIERASDSSQGPHPQEGLFNLFAAQKAMLVEVAGYSSTSVSTTNGSTDYDAVRVPDCFQWRLSGNLLSLKVRARH